MICHWSFANLPLVIGFSAGLLESPTVREVPIAKVGIRSLNFGLSAAEKLIRSPKSHEASRKKTLNSTYFRVMRVDLASGLTDGQHFSAVCYGFLPVKGICLSKVDDVGCPPDLRRNRTGRGGR